MEVTADSRWVECSRKGGIRVSTFLEQVVLCVYIRELAPLHYIVFSQVVIFLVLHHFWLDLRNVIKIISLKVIVFTVQCC